MISAYHTKYHAYELTRRCPVDSIEKLADEVGLGKTIEAGLVISQNWADRL